MSAPTLNISNARDPEQIRRMKALQDGGLCYFCKQGSIEDKTFPSIVHEGKFWYITKNDFPLPGSVHHYLIVPHRHAVSADNCLPEEASELFALCNLLAQKLNTPGYSLFIRSGDMTLTGATLDHVHWHFLVGGPKPKDAIIEDVVPVVIAYKKR